MTPFKAWRDGVRRVVSAPSVLVGVWTITTVAALPLAYAMHGAIVAGLGRSLTADAAARGMSYEWMQEFGGQATGLASTFRPTIVGFSAALDNLSAFIDNVRRPSAIAAAGGVYALIWLFLGGAVIDRYAGSPARTKGFFSAGATYFFRFFRLALVAAIAYGLLFGALHPWLFAKIYPRLTRGVDAEPAAFAIRLGLYAVFLLILAAVSLVFDYAKVRVVVEDRRSMIVALAASWRFIRRHPSGAVGVYLLNTLLFAAMLGAYAVVAPPGGGMGMMAWAAFAIGQSYIAGRLCVRLLFFASETAIVEAGLKACATSVMSRVRRD